MATRILHLYLITVFLFNFAHSYFFATYSIFLTERGMGLLEMNSINACFMIFGIFSEVPTGSFADSFSRKKSIVIGYLLLSTSFLVYFYSHTFWFFVIAEIIGAFGNSFVNGAMEAWAIDSLKFHNYGGSLQKVFKHESDFRVIGFGAGGLFGAYLGSIEISYPWLAGSISFLLLGAIFSIVLKEKYFVRHEEKNNWKEKRATGKRLGMA